MISRLFVLLIACGIACVALGVDGVVNHQSNSAQLRNAKSYKQYSTASLDTPTAKPTQKAKASPTAKPVISPTAVPIVETAEPTADPIADPTLAPTYHPTEQPVANPTANPIADPTLAPTFLPTEQPVANPTANPIADPSLAPTFLPTEQPVANPTANPIADPTLAPTFLPTEQPVSNPTANPIANPTLAPTFLPTERPIAQPTYLPSVKPVAVPTYAPTFKPSVKPLLVPTRAPSRAPTAKRPTVRPTRKPSAKPTTRKGPSARPTRKPSMRPSRRPTRMPSAKPKTPTRKPTRKPTRMPTKKQRRPICRVSQTFEGVTLYSYEQNPEGCIDVLKATIVAAIHGLAAEDIQEPEVYQALLPVDNGNLRVAVQEEEPEGISVEYTIAIEADSELTYDDVSTQLAASVESHHFSEMLHQYALSLNVTQLVSASSLSIETSEVTATDTDSSRSGSDALGSDGIVGIVIGLCALLLLSAYAARLYVLRRAAGASQLEPTGAESPKTAELAASKQEDAWTDNPLSAYSSHGTGPSAPLNLTNGVAVAEACVKEDA